MYCPYCGNKLPDDAVFCSECGAMLKASDDPMPPDPVTYDIYAAEKASRKNRNVGIVAVVIAAVLIVGICFAVVSKLGGRSYKSTINTYVTAQFKGDIKAIMELIPENMLDALLEEEGMTKSELYIEGAEEFESVLNQIDQYYGDWSYSYQIKETETLSADEVSSEYGYLEYYCDLTVSAAKNAVVELTITGDANEVSYSLDLALIKVGRSWYIDITSGDFSIF